MNKIESIVVSEKSHKDGGIFGLAARAESIQQNTGFPPDYRTRQMNVFRYADSGK